jgi:SnoaL-like protein
MSPSTLRNWQLVAVVFVACGAASAQAPTTLTADDRAAIQSLVTSYAKALGGCRAEEFADLFVPQTGSFASGFRGRMVGRDKLIALVQSERHCVAPAGDAVAARPGGGAGPPVAIEPTPAGARGIANLGTAEYQDEYTKTAAGWRFASRTVILGTEKAAGIEAADLLAIERLGGSTLGDNYEADQNGAKPRLLTSGVRVSVSGTEVKGRAFLKDGSYNDEVYEKLGPGQWRVKSSVHVAAAQSH